jgi:hypothetical protein
MSKNYGDEVSGGGFPLSNVGDVMELVYIRKADDDEYGRAVYIFKDEFGNNLDLRGCYDLDGKMKKFGSGAELRIERKEDQPTKSGGKMKIYKIQCVPGTENEGKFDEQIDEPVTAAKIKTGWSVGDKVPPSQIADAKQWIKNNGKDWSIDTNGQVLPF